MKKNQNFNNNKVWISGPKKNSEGNKISKYKNIILWIITSLIIFFGVVITIYLDILGLEYSNFTTSLVVIVLCLSLLVARFTNQGCRFWSFFQASKLELAKVVLPTRKETITITAMVVAVIVIFALIISLFGVLFERFIQYFLG